MPAGVYTVSAAFEGFETAQQTVSLAGQTIALMFELGIAQQETAIEVAGKRSVLANANLNYTALRNGEPTGNYRIDNLVLKRDAGVFTFRSGHFSFLPAVEGRVVTVVFVGEGTFSLTPVIGLEKKYLTLITGHTITAVQD